MIFFYHHFLYCHIFFLCHWPCCLFVIPVPRLSPFSDRAPQILDLDSNLEWNLNSSPKIFCSATGNPLPSHNSIELRKLDSTVLKVESGACNTPAKITYSNIKFTHIKKNGDIYVNYILCYIFKHIKTEEKSIKLLHYSCHGKWHDNSQ